MRGWTGPLLVMTAIAVFTHWLTLYLVPVVIMDRAMAALEARGVALHAFTVPQRVTPQTQQIVRSSPDLYYALCRYDLSAEEWPSRESGRGLEVSMAQWDDYQSLSFFDAQTNNFATIRGTGKAIKVTMWKGGSGYVEPNPAGSTKPGRLSFTVYSPTETGVVLIRRLAPSDEAFAKAAEPGRGDQCLSLIKPGIGY